MQVELTCQTYSRSAANTSIPSRENPSKRARTTTSTTTKSKTSEKSKTRASTRQPKKDSKAAVSSPSPQKKARQQKQQVEPTRSLHNFFQPATDEQRWSFSKSDAGSRQGLQGSSFAEELEDDLIEDDWLEDDWIKDDLLGDTSRPQKLTIRDSVKKQDATVSTTSKPALRASSKRFILDDDAPVERTEKAKPIEMTDRRPWSEKYAPFDIDQLAVHKKKVADVREWLSAALSGRSRHVSFDVCLLIQDHSNCLYRKYLFCTVRPAVERPQPSRCCLRS